MFEASRIIDSAKYQFWVRAVTKVNEGDSTRTITVLPTIKIPAQIVSFSQVLVMRWKKNVTLNCKRVGMPYPQPVWTKGGRSIISSGRYQVTQHALCCEILRYHNVPRVKLLLFRSTKTDRWTYTTCSTRTEGTIRAPWRIHTGEMRFFTL